MRNVLSLVVVVGGMLLGAAYTGPARAATAVQTATAATAQNWYNPSARPGMVSRYDINNRHAGVRAGMNAVRKVSGKGIRQRIAKAAAAQAGIGDRPMPFYMPLTRPGMTRAYDIAGWHSRKASSILRAGPAIRARSAHPVADAQSQRTSPSWYVPSTRPGMIDRYDIANTHRRKS